MASVDYTAQIDLARKNGYSDEDIVAHLSTTDPRVKTAIDSGYAPTEVISFLSTPPKPVETPSILADVGQKVQSFGAGVGRGVGNVALTGQDWLGQAVSALGGADLGGDWLQKNAQEGQVRLSAEGTPYQERNPYAFGGGKITGEVIGVAPVLRAGGAAMEAANLPTFGKAFQSGGMDAKNAFMRAVGGGGAGAVTSLLTDPENTALGTVIGAAVPSVVAPVVTKIGTKIAESAVPATDAIKREAKKLYQAIDNSGVRIVQPIVQQLSAGMDNFVQNTQQYLKRSHTAVNTALDELKGFAAEPLSITRLNTYYKSLRKSAARTGGAEGSVLDAMADTVSEFMDRLSPRELGGATARDVVNLRAANELQHRAYKSKVIDDILQTATVKGEGETAAVSTATAIRRGFQNLLANENKMKAFTPEERALIEKVAKGGYSTKLLNLVSKIGPGKVLTARALVYGLTGHLGGLPGIAAAATGEGAATAWRNALVKGQGNKASLLIRNKGPVTSQARAPAALTPATVSAWQQALAPKNKNKNAMAR